jgi:uncharacterized protein
MKACSILAGSYLAGEGVAKNLARACELNQRACDGGESGACFVLGLAYEAGAGVAKDVVRARALYEKACGLGDKKADALGCQELGRLYDQGIGVQKKAASQARL